MVKVRAVGNRLSIGSWSLPFRSNSQRRQSSMAATASGESIPVDHSKIGISNTSLQPGDKPPTTETTTSSKMVPTTSLIELAGTITRETEKLEKYLKDNGIEMPGFGTDSPLNFPRLPDEVKKAREEVIRATRELGDLVTGPTETVRWMAWDVSNTPAVIYYRN